jgi:hypothetical protein
MPTSSTRTGQDASVETATWILAVATSVLALSVPIAYATWLGQRREARRVADIERERERDERVLDRARKEFASQEQSEGNFWLSYGFSLLGTVLLALFTWALNDDLKRLERKLKRLPPESIDGSNTD